MNYMEKNFSKAICFLALVLLASSALSAVEAPAIVSSTHQDSVWSNKISAKFSWASLEDSNFLYQVTGNNSPNEEKWKETDKNVVILSNIGEGQKNFFLKACSVENECSEIAVFKMLIDRTSPGPTSDIIASSMPSGIVISWEGASDLDSGIRNYAVYRSANQSFGERKFLPTDVGVKRFTDILQTEFTDTNNLEPGISYYYRIQAFDNAGNAGILSDTVRVLNSNVACNFAGSLEVSEPAGEGKNAMKITGNIEMQSAVLKIKLPEKQAETVFEGMDGNEILFDYEIPQGVSGKAIAILTFTRGEGVRCENSFEFDVDSVVRQEVVPDTNKASAVKEEVQKGNSEQEGVPVENQPGLLAPEQPKGDNNWLLLAGAVLLVIAILFFYNLPKVHLEQKASHEKPKKWPK